MYLEGIVVSTERGNGVGYRTWVKLAIRGCPLGTAAIQRGHSAVLQRARRSANAGNVLKGGFQGPQESVE